MTATYNPALIERLIAAAKKHALQALWRPLIDIAACNVGPATAEAIQWLDGQRNPLLALADQLEAAKAEVAAWKATMVGEIERYVQPFERGRR